MAGDLFVRIDTRAAYPHMRAAIDRLKPDVMLYDISDFAAGLAAEAAGLPAVSVSITQGIHMQRLAPTIAEALDEVRAEIGLDPDPRLERLAATPCFSLIPKALEDPATEGSRPDPALPRRGAARAAPAAGLVAQRRVAAGLPHLRHRRADHRPLPAALSRRDRRALGAPGAPARDRRPRSDPAELGPVAPNVHVARWIPQADVMPHAAAMVCHGGSGTVTAAMAAGVPAVVVPVIADQFHNARRIAELGMGLTVEPDDIVRLPDAVRALLADDSYRDAAARVARETSGVPSVDTATAILRALAVARP